MKNKILYLSLSLLALFIIIIVIFVIYIVNDNKKNILDICYIKNNNKKILPKKIFTYWHEEDITNKLVKSNFEYLKKTLPKYGYEFIIYNEISIKDELSEEEYKFINEYKQKFADLVRLVLLKKYGGIWMDSTVLIINPLFLDNIINSYNNKEFDVFLFEFRKLSYDDKIYNKYFENSFIVAHLNSPFIENLYN
jgi:mannosyltransferase OCH1-like enzyme